MGKTLQLNIYLMRSTRACMVFKRNGILYRINNLTDPLVFVANLVQLNKAIDSGAEQRCYLNLYDHKGKCWVVGCTFLNNIVSLNLWLDDPDDVGFLKIRFCWDGSAADFGKAVNEMCKMVNCAKVFNVPEKG